MSRGKEICKELKAVRRRIAEENGIPLEMPECTHKGPCRGTCPRCEAEVRYLENALADRLRLGKAAVVAGVALGLASCGSGNNNTANDTDEVVYTGEPLPPIEESDTAQHVADSAKYSWHDPGMLDVVVGEMEVIDSSDISALQDEDSIVDDQIYGVIDGMDPEYPGGIEAMYQFVKDNLEYPQLALENGIKGKVFLSFVVEKDGSISDVKVLRDIGGGCGLAAKRVVESMPKWKPGTQSGKPVRNTFTLPVTFVLPEDCPRVIEGMAPTQGMPMDSITDERIGPFAPTQQMEVEGVKVKVK